MNPFDMLKDLGSLKEKLQTAQAELATIRATGTSGGNMVAVTLNGKFEMLDIKLDPICVDNRDVPMLQDLIRSAHHAAIDKVQEEIKARLGPMVSGLNIPGLNV
ncbi:MAG: YbaB/EbfC family nucleoid-associated protein [Treponema sp.]|nr:YbaB/EbfC family nucleoid-associated protein [Treponema sp.]MBQ6565535.1 YbaB/EbfC family nucleoid-associated protein [Treponema sp.]MBQ7167946.1 YbaB/EbfC family nucleoid-associated protein [Treponema sp.]